MNPKLRAALEGETATLRAWLDRVDHQLRHPDEPVLGRLDTPEDTPLEQALVAGEATLLAQAVLARAPDADLLDLTLDLGATVAHLDAHFGRLAQLTRVQAEFASLPRQRGVPLLPGELEAAAARVLEAARVADVPLPPAWQPGGSALLLWQSPEGARDPRAVPWTECLPPGVPGPGEEALRVLAAEEAPPTRRLAAALLLHVHARGRQEAMPVLDLLDLTVRLTHVLGDEEREDAVPAPQVGLLRSEAQALVEALGKPRIAALRPGTVVPRTQRAAVRAEAWTWLRLLRAARHGVTAQDQAVTDTLLWQVFERLDATLERGVTPETDSTLRAQMHLSALLALVRTPRSPGGALPVLVELAAELSGLDPLWAWSTVQPGEDPGPTSVEGALHRLFTAHELLDVRSASYWPDVQGRAERLIARAAGHLGSVLRARHLTLPDQAFLNGYLRTFGPAPGRAMTADEYTRFQQELAALYRELIDRRDQAAPEAAVQETPLPASPTALPDVPGPSQPPAALPEVRPAHVREAAALLRGTRVTLLGGLPDPAHHAALVHDLELAELDWVNPDEYAHGKHAAARVTPQTGLVILAIRWMGHAHAGLREVARDRGVPCVLHLGGLNPSSVAYQVLAQVSGRLGR